jgi:hypothetical protein
MTRLSWTSTLECLAFHEQVHWNGSPFTYKYTGMARLSWTNTLEWLAFHEQAHWNCSPFMNKHTGMVHLSWTNTLEWLAFHEQAHWNGSPFTNKYIGMARLSHKVVVRWLVGGFSSRQLWFCSWSGRVGFVVNRVALGQFFSEYFGFPFQFSFQQLLGIH